MKGVKRVGRAWVFLVVGSLAGCLAHYPVNQPLSPEPSRRPLLDSFSATSNSDSLFIMLFFSGGGTRAAALSYGVLEELARTRIVWEGRPCRLLDEVDLISSVSGGSFTAAYYCLYGDRIFSEFEEAFLRRNVQGHLAWKLFSPASWFRLASSKYGRSDLAAEYYDTLLFQKATFADWAALRRKPYLMINATDLGNGAWFPLVEDQFERIGSEIASFPIARAVAASSAVPGVLSAVTLKNYGGTLEGNALPLRDATAGMGRWRAHREARRQELQVYQDSRTYPYIHLVDGGVSDNLGLSGVAEAFEEAAAGGRSGLATQFDFGAIRTLVLIVVNASTSPTWDWEYNEGTPGAWASMSAVTRIFMGRSSLGAKWQLQENLLRWIGKRTEDLAGLGSGHGIEVYPIEIQFDDLPSLAEQRFCHRLPTSFALPDQAIDRLRRSAAVLLRQSEPFRNLVDELQEDRQLTP